MAQKTNEPAVESYFYWKGDWIKNVVNVFINTFRRNNAQAADFISKMRSCGNFLLGILYFFAMIFCVLGSFIFTPILFLLFAIIFVFIWIIYNTLAFIFWFIESLYQYFHGIYVICPACNKRIDMPVYLCPKCGAEHHSLLPSPRYGIFVRKCKCKKLIPTSIMWGKNKVKAKCPNCSNTSGIQMNYSPTTIAFIGGMSVGKTFLRDSMAAYLPGFARKHKINYKLLDEDKPQWEALATRMQRGILPGKTADNLSGNIRAMKIEIWGKQQTVPERLYLYDPPGESFNAEEKLDPYNYYQNLKTAVMVIDPFSLPGIRPQFQGTIGHISSVAAVSCFEKWLNSMESSHFQKLDDLKKVKCAVVITKVDVPQLKKLVQLPVGASSEECEQFLETYGGSDVIAHIKEFLGEYHIFAVSCSGGVNPGSTFQPQGLDNVWEWILETDKTNYTAIIVKWFLAILAIIGIILMLISIFS